jgi:hypothetical protein
MKEDRINKLSKDIDSLREKLENFKSPFPATEYNFNINKFHITEDFFMNLHKEYEKVFKNKGKK